MQQQTQQFDRDNFECREAASDAPVAANGPLPGPPLSAGAAVYGQPGAEGPEAPPPPEGEGEAPAEEGTVEGEFREV